MAEIASHLITEQERSFHRQRRSGLLKKFLAGIATVAFFVGIGIFTWVLVKPDSQRVAKIKAEDSYMRSEKEEVMFRSALRLETIADNPVTWEDEMRDVNSTAFNNLKNFLLEKILGAFAAEGFVLSSAVDIVMSPLNVTVYTVMNRTVTSLTYAESTEPETSTTDQSRVPGNSSQQATRSSTIDARNNADSRFDGKASSTESAKRAHSFRKLVPRIGSAHQRTTPFQRSGTRFAVRFAFSGNARPSRNAVIVSQLGEDEAGVVQFMLSNYLASQKIIAAVEPIEVTWEFRRAVQLAILMAPRVAEARALSPQIEGDEVDCRKRGDEVGVSHTVVRCPSNCLDAHIANANVIGSIWYHMTSSICRAAIHAGAVKAGESGLVEFIDSGFSFSFQGRVENGINSTSLNEYGRKFFIKKTGPSWIKQSNESTGTKLADLQGNDQNLMSISFSLLEFLGVKMSYAEIQLGNPSFAAQIKEELAIKVRTAVTLLGLATRRVYVAAFQPPLAADKSIRVKVDVLGMYEENARPMFPYVPWAVAELERFGSDVMDVVKKGELKLTDEEVKLDAKFLDSLFVSLTTLATPGTRFPGSCRCGEVFFIQSVESSFSASDADHLTSMYSGIFDAFYFDQVGLGFGFAVMTPQPRRSPSRKANTQYLLPDDAQGGAQPDKPRYDIITSVGQDSTTNTLRQLNDVIKGLDFSTESVTTEKVWQMLEKLEDQTSFLTERLDERRKLLVVSSRFVIGPDAETNKAYLARIKERGIKVIYVGHEWDRKQMRAHFYPQSYASSPPSDHIHYVDSLDDVGVLTSFLIKVVSEYICQNPTPACSDLQYFLPPPADLLFNVTSTTDDNSIGSYKAGIPTGEGLKPYEETGGVRFRGVSLARTVEWRKTEPDEKQAFYLNYQCGSPVISPDLREGRIVGGSEAEPHSWPWTVSINTLKGNRHPLTGVVSYRYNFWMCGGSIVARRWIVTAAHCFAKSRKQIPDTKRKVVVGQHDQLDLAALPGHVYSIEKVVHHPDYDDQLNRYDLALLMLDRDIQYGRRVQPVCLPNADVVPSTGRKCWVAGWGFTSNTAATARNKLRQTAQHVVSPSICQKVWRAFYYDPNLNMCVTGSSPDEANVACRGDSGGPLVCLENNRWVQYGVVNYGPSKCESGNVGVYFLVPSTLDWICCYLGDIGPCAYVKCAYGKT